MSSKASGIAGKPGALAGLIDYQDDSIVSTEIIKRPTGNITLFAFDAGTEVSEHTAPFDALVHIIDGEAQVMIEGKMNTLKAGDAIIMPTDKPHSLKAVKKFKMLLAMIRS